MATRQNVTGVPPQGGYVAKQCPVRAQNHALQPTTPIEPSAVLERRFLQGIEFEEEVIGALLGLHLSAVLIEAADATAREAATADAMSAGASLIFEARLPQDDVGRRVGKPDLLVAAEGSGYRAVDIKNHGTLEAADPAGKGLPALCSELDRPPFELATLDEGISAKKRMGDLMQLAHYQRMLESAGFAASEGRFGGIIGVERRVVWYDLDAPIWRTDSSSGRKKLRSTMEIYDFEFDFRLDIIAVAQQHIADPQVDLLVVPVRISECPDCPWWGYCRPILESGSGDVSLLPNIGWREWKIHRSHGVHDRRALAALDSRTARLVAGGG